MERPMRHLIDRPDPEEPATGHTGARLGAGPLYEKESRACEGETRSGQTPECRPSLSAGP